MKIKLRLKDIPIKIYLRYALLNLLGVVVLVGILLIIRSYIPLPGWAIALVVAVWILKDVVLFPLVWQSYDWDRPGISRAMTGAVGVVKRPLTPKGFVQIDGELWKAKNMGSEKIIEIGASVRVIKRIGLTVQVIALDTNGKTEKES